MSPLTLLASAQTVCDCDRCGEGVYFVPGVRGPARWRHQRTGLVECSPLCGDCGEAASCRVGRATVGGDGLPRFEGTGWLCGRCANRQLFIDHT